MYDLDHIDHDLRSIDHVLIIMSSPLCRFIQVMFSLLSVFVFSFFQVFSLEDISQYTRERERYNLYMMNTEKRDILVYMGLMLSVRG